MFFLERGNDFMAVTSIFRPELFYGQVFLITGGGTGIGRAIARELSSLGASVAICSRSMAHLEDTRASIEATGRQVLAQACDIRNEKQVNAQVQAVLERFGRLDGLVNNVSSSQCYAFAHFSTSGNSSSCEFSLNLIDN
jgi:citronellol/citronellal dehydrogenase